MRLPWKRREPIKAPPAPPKPPLDTGGSEAKAQAVEALEDAVNRRQETNALRTLLARDLERNHYAEHIQDLFRGAH